MSERRKRRLRTRAAGMVAFSLTMLTPASAQAQSGGYGARWNIGPFVDADLTDTGYSLVGGIEAYPSSVSAIGGRLSAIVLKGDPTTSRAEIGSERYDFGLRLQLLSEFGRGTRNPGP